MAGTFIDMVDRIAVELRRSNLATDIKNGINDAIQEAAQNRFYFNEMHTSFPTVGGLEYYDDLGLVEIDAAWFLQGSTRYNLGIESQLEADLLSMGNVTGGQLQSLSRYGGQLRLYPIPSGVTVVFLDGYGKLAPSPLVADTDTNAWLTIAEQYIRALAKRNVLRDVVRDVGEARIYEGTAEEYADKLVEQTTLRSSTGKIRSTCF